MIYTTEGALLKYFKTSRQSIVQCFKILFSYPREIIELSTSIVPGFENTRTELWTNFNIGRGLKGFILAIESLVLMRMGGQHSF